MADKRSVSRERHAAARMLAVEVFNFLVNSFQVSAIPGVLFESLVADLAGFVVFVVLGVVRCVLELRRVDLRTQLAVEDPVHDLVESLETVVRLSSGHLFADAG